MSVNTFHLSPNVANFLQNPKSRKIPNHIHQQISINTLNFKNNYIKMSVNTFHLSPNVPNFLQNSKSLKIPIHIHQQMSLNTFYFLPICIQKSPKTPIAFIKRLKLSKLMN